MSAKNIFSMSCGGFDFIQSEKKNVTLLSFLKTQRALRKINAHGIFFQKYSIFCLIMYQGKYIFYQSSSPDTLNVYNKM